MWYVYDSDLVIQATCSGEPDHDDLTTREEAAFFSTESFGLGWKVLLDEQGAPVSAEPVPEENGDNDDQENEYGLN